MPRAVTHDERQTGDMLTPFPDGRGPIAAGCRHSIGRRIDGTVLTAGNGAAGECSVAGWSDVVAVAVGNVHAFSNTGKSHTLGLRADGAVLATGWNTHGQCNVGDWANVRAIALQATTAPGSSTSTPGRTSCRWRPATSTPSVSPPMAE